MTPVRSRIDRLKIAVFGAIAAAALSAGAWALVMPEVSFAAPAELAYFQGKWSITLKGDAAATYTWTVTDDMKGEWITGVVEKDGERASTDHWRINGGLIERYIFTNEGLSIKLVSSGWKSGRLILNGIGSGKATDFRIRETIIKETERRFRTVWERQAEDGKWSVFSEETVAK